MSMGSFHKEQGTSQASVAGTVSRVTFHNPDTGFFVARIDVAGRPNPQTVVGVSPSIEEGEFLEAAGKWETSQFGRQLKAEKVTLTQPQGLEGILKYLASSVPGVGPGSAKKLVEAFGTTVFDVIEKTPERLREVPGIGKKRAESIAENYKEHQHLRRVLVFLHQHGLSSLRAFKVYEALGAKTEEKVRENPYILCKVVWGIGFSTADRVAQRMGLAHDAPYRIRAALHHVLEQASLEGSCGLPASLVIDRATELLVRKLPDGEMLTVERTLVRQIAREQAELHELVADRVGEDVCLFLPSLYQTEAEIARTLNARLLHPQVQELSDDAQAILLHAELETGLSLAHGQRAAVLNSLVSPVSVITGGPGVGKTQCTRVLIAAFVEEGLTVALCAPTGKAARRATEATGHPAKTVHRLLEVKNGGFVYNRENRLPADVVIADEMSMADVRLFRQLLSALRDEARLVLIGDVDQLPSVGPGKVLNDLIDSGRIPVRRLTEVFRQAATSRIVTNAHRVNRGETPETDVPKNSDFVWQSHKHKTVEAGVLAARMVKTVRDLYKLGYDPLRDVQLLTPMRRGPLGVEVFNSMLAEVLNPHPETKVELLHRRYATGDKVMQIRNNYNRGTNGVTNGEIGFISRIDTSAREIFVQFEEEELRYPFADVDELVPAFAITIHKSQGSEFPVVVMPVDSAHFVMLKRNLVYTGITRARRLCIVMGSDWAMGHAVENSQVEMRYTKLRDFLQGQKPVERSLVRRPGVVPAATRA